ncbi:MAG TPA: TonB-dependent receptor [Acidobacteriaceae bacterium]
MNCKQHPSPRPAAWLLSLATAAFSLLTICLLVCPAASAQLAGKGAITGTVADASGAAIPGATIVISNDANGISVTTKSTSAGDYSVSSLDPGIYTVTVTFEGFQQLTQKNVHVNALETQDFNPKLTVGASTETVTVTTAPAALETSNAVLGATMEQEMYSALPIQMGAAGSPDQRRATDFAVLMPGVQGNETNGNLTTNTGVVNGSGSRGAASAVYVNGIPFTSVAGEGDTRFVWTAISVDAVDQFQVQTSGYSAEYEGMGVQNYSTKAGTNKFHGSVYDFFRNTALDTWGFFTKLPGPITASNPTGAPSKPSEHMNEYGVVLSGPIWKNKLFLFGNWNEYRFSHGPAATYQTLPTQAEYNGNFTDQGVGIYDPHSTVCNTAGTACTRTKYANNTITAIDPIAQYLQHFQQADYGTLPSTIGNNFVGGYKYGLYNWMTTDRLDWVVNSRNTLSITFGKGRQASAGPASQTTAGRNVTPFAPYNYGQVYAPKTTVWTVQDAYVISPHLVNQFNYGFGRYNGPTFNPNSGGPFAASAAGITGLLPGQASNAFPLTNFSGTNAPTSWAGSVANTAISNSYIATDNVQWALGKHSLTIGAQIAWMEYQYLLDATGTSPLTISLANSETSGFKCAAVGGVTPATGTCDLAHSTSTIDPTTGFSYASFLAGAPDSQTLVDNLAIVETGARFRPISPYVQDDWKVSSRLTLNLGLRWDYYPTYREEHDRLSFLDPNGTNPLSGNKGIVAFAGSGTAQCNCRTNVSDYFKNFGPRIGFAFQTDPTTVIRGSYGVIYTHGNGVGGSAGSRNGTGTLGYSSTPKPTFNNTRPNTDPVFANQFLAAGFFQPVTNPQPTLPNLSPTIGTGNYVAGGPSPQGVGYGDPYLGGRAPQYIVYSLGMQHTLTNSITLTASYVGSQGHFLITDGGNARGQWIDQLNPAFLAAGANALNASATPANVQTALTRAGLSAPNYNSANFDPTQKVYQALKPFPQYTVSDTYGNIANSNYNGLQTSIIKRASNGLTFMINYTWSRAIDNGGTFRSGYDIPAAFSGNGKAWKVDSIERNVSTSNQPHHFVGTNGV